MAISKKNLSPEAVLQPSKSREGELQKSLSPLDVWSLALGCIIGWGAFVMPGNTFLIRAGTAGTMIAMTLGAVIMVIIALNYHFMISRNPVAGGGFAYANKEFGRTHGFICAWFLVLSYLSVVPMNATALALLGRNLTGALFQFGFHYSFAGYDIYLGELLLALSVLVLFGLLSMKGTKDSGSSQTVLTIALVGGVAIFAAAALVNPKATFANLSTPCFPENVNRVASVLSVLAVAPWAFFGFDTIPQAAEEYNFSHQKARRLMILSIVFGALIYITLNTVTASIVPAGYSTYIDYIKNIPNTKGLMSLPTFYAAYRLLGVSGLILLGVAVLGAILSGINGFYMATSRLLYSMARQGVVPCWFGKLSKKRKTPCNAILFVMLISMMAPFFGRTALGWIVDMSSIGAAVGFGYTSAASLKRAMVEKYPFTIATSIMGIIFSIIFVLLLLIPSRTFGCSLGRESMFCLAVWVILGIFFYMRQINTHTEQNAK